MTTEDISLPFKCIFNILCEFMDNVFSCLFNSRKEEKMLFEERINFALTENGAGAYETSGHSLLDLNFRIPSFRTMSYEDIVEKITKCLFFDEKLTIKWLFYVRDVREGLGERRTFNVMMNALASIKPELVSKVIELIPEYGRWDDVLAFMGTPLEEQVIDMIRRQLDSDTKNMNAGKPVSLCAKWMASTNASSKPVRKVGSKIALKLNRKRPYEEYEPAFKALSEWSKHGKLPNENDYQLISEIFAAQKSYRKTLSDLRSYLDVVEVKMSAGKWNEIKYESVPSLANIRYKNAFMLHDQERRSDYLDSLSRGEAKINAGVLYPHDIVCKYLSHSRFSICPCGDYDETLESLWKSLPDKNLNGNVLVIRDGSSSMACESAGDGTIADIADALSIYFSERMVGPFKNKFITFSANPEWVDLSNCNSLYQKLEELQTHNDWSNTNIEAVFDMILDAAILFHADQEDLPSTILIVSDMQFDVCVNNRNGQHASPYLFESLKKRYEINGYKMPKLVFWNVSGKSTPIPVIENECGVALISGYSINNVDMIMSNKTDPYECLLEKINSERYKPIEDALGGVS